MGKKWLKWLIFGGIIGVVILELANIIVPFLWILLVDRMNEQYVYSFSWEGRILLRYFLTGSAVGLIVFWIKEKLKR